MMQDSHLSDGTFVFAGYLSVATAITPVTPVPTPTPIRGNIPAVVGRWSAKGVPTFEWR